MNKQNVTDPENQTINNKTTSTNQVADSETNSMNQAADSKTNSMNQAADSETNSTNQAADSETSSMNQAADSKTVSIHQEVDYNDASIAKKGKKTLSRTQQKVIAIIGMVLFAAVVAVLCIVAIPLIQMASNPEEFRAWIDQMGFWGRLIYMGLVILQIVVAFIPGEPLEIVAGYAFGTVEGTILCILAASIGSILVLFLVRRFGVYILEVFFSKEKIESLKFLQESPKKTLIFSILFILPGTPKDLLCYFAGLTSIRMWLLCLICTIGRFPSIITSTLGGDALGTQNYTGAIIVLIATLALSGIGVLIYKLISKKNSKPQDASSMESGNTCSENTTDTSSKESGNTYSENTTDTSSKGSSDSESN